MSKNCDICNVNIDINVNICESIDCEYKSRSIYQNDNYISNFISKNTDEAIFLLNTAKEAIIGKDMVKFYSPFPGVGTYVKKEMIDTLLKVIPTFDIQKEVLQMKTMQTDLNIFDNYNPIMYGFIKFTLKSNLISIHKIDMFTIPTLKTYEVIHDPYDISEFNKFAKQNKSTYLFHGSKSAKWYSIMMNGLKNYSNTENMTNGAVYGAGIYLSSSFDESIKYCLNNNNFTIGVFEVIGTKYKKLQSIHVINNENTVRMRYILTNNSERLDKNNILEISNKFNKSLVQETITKTNYLSNMRNKRLMVEIKKVPKDIPDENGFLYNINESNMLVWNCYISKIDNSSKLYADMQKLNINQIELEIRFDNQFPIKPPFVRVISPIFQFKTGHITIGGSICMELLTNQGWSPIYSMENLMIHIKSTILEDGRLDLTKKNIKYSLQEAQSAFQRMIITHGWN
jgi:ubiquitin-conjugating enzyme E2 Q